MSITDKLNALAKAKQNLKNAIELKTGASFNAPLSEFANKIAAIPATLTSTPTWTRPADWLALPTLTASDQKFVGLHAVYQDNNFVAFTVSGAYTVNWGDGLTENFAAGATAYHQYDYTNANLNGTLTSRGYKQAIITITPQSGQSLTSINLHVKHSQAGLGLYQSGFLDIAVAGSLLDTFLVATPTLVGSTDPTFLIRFDNLEQVNLVKTAVQYAMGMFMYCRNLQSVVNLSFKSMTVTSVATSMSSGNVTKGTFVPTVNQPIVLAYFGTETYAGYSSAQIQTKPMFVKGTGTSTFTVAATQGGTALTHPASTVTIFSGIMFEQMFSGCYKLRSIPYFDASQVVSMYATFQNTNITSFPALDTSNCRIFTLTLAGIPLTTLPNWNFTNAASINQTFTKNHITTVPSITFDPAKLQAASGAFQTCRFLTTIPAWDFSGCRSVGIMFNTCTRLETLPALNVANSGSMQYFVSGASRLRSITGTTIDMSQATTCYAMYRGCSSLKTLPNINMPLVTDMPFMFNDLHNLVSIGNISAPSITSSGTTTIFSILPRLETIGNLTFTKLTGTLSINGFANLTSVGLIDTTTGAGTIDLSNSYSLRSVNVANNIGSIDLSNSSLSATALNQIYTSLPTIATGKTVTVSGNWGTATDNPSIATGKGWIVNG